MISWVGGGHGSTVFSAPIEEGHLDEKRLQQVTETYLGGNRLKFSYYETFTHSIEEPHSNQLTPRNHSHLLQPGGAVVYIGNRVDRRGGLWVRFLWPKHTCVCREGAGGEFPDRRIHCHLVNNTSFKALISCCVESIRIRIRFWSKSGNRRHVTPLYYKRHCGAGDIYLGDLII